jgi:hypothetical protein
MRRFEHPPGQVWDVVIGRASWGSLFALFVPVRAAEPVRQTLLHASSQEAAETELESLDQHALAALLDRSTPKDE